MVTNQIMTRKMGSFDVFQRTKDGFFDATALIKQWNAIESNTKKDIKDYLYINPTMELIKTICEREGLLEKVAKSGNFVNQVVSSSFKKRDGKSGRPEKVSFMHPVLFIDFAMWLNPTFKYDAIKFVYDQMIFFRNESGDAYKELASSVSKIVSDEFMPKAISKVAEAINYIVFSEHYPNIRNSHGSENEMRELFSLERKLADLINDGFIEDYDSLINYMRKLWHKKHDSCPIK